MTSVPDPLAVTSPAVAPGAPELLIGKIKGAVEIQVKVGELVRSWTVGAVEKVP